MPDKILISGGSGLIGMELSKLLMENGFEVAHLTRSKEANFPYKQFEWDIPAQKIEEEAMEFADAVIHLAGASVADKRWTDKRKKQIIKSRTESASLLRKAIERQGRKIQYFIGASGVNYYGVDTGDQLMTEEDPAGESFLPNVCKKWEQATDEIAALGIKTAKVRIGVVLAEKGGALSQLEQPIKLGVGAPLGSGKQFMSWIHINDLCGIFLHMLKNKPAGTFNAVAPNPVTNEELTKAVARELNKPLWLPNIPPFAMKLLLGEMAAMILGGVKASSGKIEEAKYSFKFDNIELALKEIYQ
ncbi:TIGR01777 family oxidoreductase [Marivirga sp. S37H4]|uniref:TIGR01777 family oxidoreductase n=1 Tax=Marivirga aurantiaca TaxID=2802615 RepID=A0A935C8J9_9BACT|nr:TIGR01777 family oxidoreductase [Marivirga aurantiaca]MBK6265540.1 TIGR01777 family oxidoreductase [Marivirga aurantiaca]